VRRWPFLPAIVCLAAFALAAVFHPPGLEAAGMWVAGFASGFALAWAGFTLRGGAQ
jgi:hypothetical protein